MFRIMAVGKVPITTQLDKTVLQLTARKCLLQCPLCFGRAGLRKRCSILRGCQVPPRETRQSTFTMAGCQSCLPFLCISCFSQWVFSLNFLHSLLVSPAISYTASLLLCCRRSMCGKTIDRYQRMKDSKRFVHRFTLRVVVDKAIK